MSTPQPDGYLATPPAGSGRPVLVLHAWWGLNDTIRDFCDRLAAGGFTAFAPDLYHGRVADTIPAAEALMRTLDDERARADVAAAAAFLDERAGGRGDLALIGFSLGANYALEYSDADPARVRKVVLFYGAGPTEYPHSRAAYLGHWAENDPYEDAEYIAEVEAGLRRAGRPATFHTYPGTTHWFFEPDRTDAYDAEAAAQAWERTLAFLNQPAAP